MGTPALPMAEITAIRTHRSMVAQVISTPLFCITNREVTSINAAQPFMLMVVHIGNTKRATLLCAPSLNSADDIVTGSVAADDLVNSAINRAGDMALMTRSGFRPLAS